MNNLNIFNVDNEQQELYFLLELDGGSQDEFNDQGVILTSLTITPIYTIFNTITFTIIFNTFTIIFNILTIIIKTLIYITIIFIIFIFSIFVIILTIITIIFNSVLTNIYNFSRIQIFIRNYNTFISIIFK